MPRDATDTRDRLLTEAERVFAVRGVHQATTREITEAAGQRNTSALTYHFGSRTGVLREILLRHGDPLDEERGRLLVVPVEEHTTRTLVAALVLPYAACLHSPSGRNYLRIIPQLADQFPTWRVEDELSPPNLRRILSELERRAGAGDAVGRERVIGAIMLLTTAMAERARAVDLAVKTDLDERRFVANLVDMLVAVIEAPGGSPA